MKLQLRFLVLPALCLLTLLAAGCSQEALPTRIATAALPTTAAPTNTPPILPPTRDLRQLATTTPEPTVVLPTRTATPTPTPARPSVRITSPSDGVQFVMGSDVIISGLVQAAPEHELQLLLISANGYLLAETTAQQSELNAWQASLHVPDAVSGPGQLVATIVDEVEELVLAQDAVEVQMVLDVNDSDRYLALFRPSAGETAVAGYNFFFDGRAQRPIDNLVTISIWHEECRTQAARQSFVLSGSGYWQGFIVVPQDLSGPACAVAHFGTPGEVGWREAQVPITIISATESESRSITIGNPPPGSIVQAGEPLLIYGTAGNARNSAVLATVLLDNGRILTEGVTTTDYWGYWELSVYFLPDTEGQAFIHVAVGEPNTPGYIQAQSTIIIRPAD
jgi:hypothetical protein